MQDTTTRRLKRICAYLAGGAFVGLGMVGLVAVRGETTPSRPDFYGYGLVGLFIISGLIICLATRFHARPVGLYAAGALVFFGTLGFLVELSKAMPSSTNFHGYVVAGILFTCGVVTGIAVRLQYRGGLWSFLGLVLVAVAAGRFALALQAYLQGRPLKSPAVFYWTAAALWGVGCYCLFWGHLRRHR